MIVFGACRIFIGFQWVLFSTQYIASALIPDTPNEVEIQCARIEFFNDKIIDRIPENSSPIEPVTPHDSKKDDVSIGDDFPAFDFPDTLNEKLTEEHHASLLQHCSNIGNIEVVDVVVTNNSEVVVTNNSVVVVSDNSEINPMHK